MILALALVMSLGAWAQGQLLTTITPDGSVTPAYSVAGMATLDDGGANYNPGALCWYHQLEKFLTVTPADGVTITKVTFIANTGVYWEDNEAPYQVRLYDFNPWDASGQKIDNAALGISTIEVYGTIAPTVTRTNDNTWKFAMPGYNAALNIEYYPGTLTFAANGNGTVTLNGASIITTHTDLATGDVLHVGDTLNFSDPDISYNINNGYTFKKAWGPYVVIRANITGEGSNTMVTPADDGAYYMIKKADNSSYFFDGGSMLLPVTSTSDGIAVTFNSESNGWKNCTFAVHEGTGSTGLPAGVEANPNGGYYVEAGTEVTLIATPDEGYYLSGWSNQSTNDTLTFTMGDSDTTLTATFAPSPTLTLVANGNGTVKLDGVLDRVFNANNMPAVGDTLREGDVIAVNEVTFVSNTFKRNGEFDPFSNFGVGSIDEHPITIAANGQIAAATYFFDPTFMENPDEGMGPVVVGNAWKVVNVENTCCISLRGILVDNPGPVNRMPAGVTETATEGQYRVLPGTTLTLIATADEVNYVSSWSNEVAVNNLTTATQTLTIEADTTIAANFAQNPVLTIAVNDDQMGSVALVFESSQDVFDYTQGFGNSEHFRLDWSSGSGNGIDLYDNGVTYHSQHGEIINSVTLTLYGYTDQTIVVSPGEWDPTTRTISNVNSTSLNIKCTDSYNVLLSGAEIDYSVMPAGIAYNTVRESRDVTLNDGNFYGINGGGFYWNGQIGGTTAMLNDGNNGQILTSASNDPAAQIEGVSFTVTQGTAPTFEPAGMTVTESGSQVILSDIPNGTRTINIINHTGERFSFSTLDVQYSVPVPVEGQYRILPGTEVTVKATANTLRHVAGWSDELNHDLSANATYSDYFVTEPENLFPAKSSLPIVVTGDSTITATFGINSYTVTATVNYDNRETIGTGLRMGTVSASYIAVDGTPDQSVAPAAEITYTAQGGSTSTLTAIPNTGYHFVKWNDDVTDNPRSLTLTLDSSFTALFAPSNYTVTYMSVTRELNVDTFKYREPIIEYIPSRNGRFFIEWSPELPELMPAENLTVYAQWKCLPVEDYDGNVYPTVNISDICWMAANMRTTHYADGREIPKIYEYQCSLYPNVQENVSIYGRLYDWYDATDTSRPTISNRIQGICPEGWFLPNEDDFEILNREDILTLRSTDYWLYNSGNNSTGFDLKPAGMFNSATARYENLRGNAYLWSATTNSEVEAHCHMADCNCYMLFDLIYHKSDAFSVRCIKE